MPNLHADNLIEIEHVTFEESILVTAANHASALVADPRQAGALPRDPMMPLQWRARIVGSPAALCLVQPRCANDSLASYDLTGENQRPTRTDLRLLAGCAEQECSSARARDLNLMKAAPCSAGCGGDTQPHRSVTGQFHAANGDGGGKQATSEPDQSQARSVSLHAPLASCSVATTLPLMRRCLQSEQGGADICPTCPVFRALSCAAK